MKSKRAKEFNNGHIKIGNLHFTAADIEYCVMLAEQDAEEEVNHYRKELEESKRREELSRKVIDDQRKKIEALKARTVEAFRESCPIKHPGLNDKGTLCDAMQGVPAVEQAAGAYMIPDPFQPLNQLFSLLRILNPNKAGGSEGHRSLSF